MMKLNFRNFIFFILIIKKISFTLYFNIKKKLHTIINIKIIKLYFNYLNTVINLNMKA